VSSADAARNWDLRCLVRERLIEFIRREYPAGLPRLRAALENGNGDGKIENAAGVRAGRAHH
jgi:hypothetical protein